MARARGERIHFTAQCAREIKSLLRRVTVREACDEHGEADESGAGGGADETPAAGEAGDAAAAEDRNTGSVSLSVFAQWMTEGGRGGLIGAALALAFLLERASYVGADIWLASWVEAAAPLSPRSGLAALAGASGSAGGGLAASFSFAQSSAVRRVLLLRAVERRLAAAVDDVELPPGALRCA